MNKTFVLISWLSCLILLSCGNSKKESKSAETKSAANSETADTTKYYNIEQGMIEYDVTAMENKGQLTVYWKDFGRVSYATGKRNMMGTMVDTYTLKDGSFTYSWTSGSKTGTKERIDKEQIGQLNYNDITDDQQQKFNIEKTGTEVFMGKTCSIFTFSYQGATSKNWVWEGITLRTETSVEDVKAVEMMGTRLSLGTAPAGDVFKIPADIEFRE